MKNREVKKWNMKEESEDRMVDDSLRNLLKWAKNTMQRSKRSVAEAKA